MADDEGAVDDDDGALDDDLDGVMDDDDDDGDADDDLDGDGEGVGVGLVEAVDEAGGAELACARATPARAKPQGQQCRGADKSDKCKIAIAARSKVARGPTVLPRAPASSADPPQPPRTRPRRHRVPGRRPQLLPPATEPQNTAESAAPPRPPIGARSPPGAAAAAAPARPPPPAHTPARRARRRPAQHGPRPACARRHVRTGPPTKPRTRARAREPAAGARGGPRAAYVPARAARRRTAAARMAGDGETHAAGGTRT